MFEERILVWRVNRGRPDAVRTIYERHKDALVTLAAGLLNEKQSAEDVVHDVFVSFINSAESFRLTGSLKGYLATCVANRARNVNRSRQVRKSESIDDNKPEPSSERSPDCEAQFSEQMQRISQLLGELAYEQREVVLLRLYSGLKFKAIAKSQGVSIGTVMGRYRYGLDKLRSMLNGELKNETE